MSSDLGSSTRTARAATVVLVRDRPSFEVVMVKRHEKMAFAAGALVFPGGKVDTQDNDERWKDHVQGWYDVAVEQRALRIAAIREVFEETGLLVSLSADKTDHGVKVSADAREAMCAGRLDFLTFARQANISLDLAKPVPFAHWITPESMPKRFDTYFYILGVDTEQQISSDGLEITHAEWIAPCEALRLGRIKERVLAFPTRLNLQLLAESRSVGEALASARKRPVVTVQSRIEQRASGRVLTIRSDAGYGYVEEPVSEVVKRGNTVSLPLSGRTSTK
jgi:8-oxo-dGTP pyrophosphatase MutT (NUDIX family)